MRQENKFPIEDQVTRQSHKHSSYDLVLQFSSKRATDSARRVFKRRIQLNKPPRRKVLFRAQPPCFIVQKINFILLAFYELFTSVFRFRVTIMLPSFTHTCLIVIMEIFLCDELWNLFLDKWRYNQEKLRFLKSSIMIGEALAFNPQNILKISGQMKVCSFKKYCVARFYVAF